MPTLVNRRAQSLGYRVVSQSLVKEIIAITVFCVFHCQVHVSNLVNIINN